PPPGHLERLWETHVGCVSRSALGRSVTRTLQIMARPPRGYLPLRPRRRLLAHVAVLVLLARAARARVVAADAVGAVAARLRLLVRLRAVGRHSVLAVARRRHQPRRLVVAGEPDHLLEPLLLLHAEYRVGDLVLHAVPHLVERLHPLPLVLRLRV